MRKMLKLAALAFALIALLAGPAWATFPVVAATNHNGTSSSSATVTVNLPASIAAGILLIIDVAMSSGITCTTPSGWTVLTSRSGSTVSDCSFWKNASGSEGATMTVTLSGTTTGGSNSVSYRITGWAAAQAPVAGSYSATIGGTGIAAQAVTPSWGLADTLWININTKSASDTVTSYPASFSGNQILVTTAGGNILAISSRNDTTATETPGAITWATAGSNVAVLLAVKPGGANLTYPISIPMLGF